MRKCLGRITAAALAAVLALPSGLTAAAESDDSIVTFIVHTAAGTPAAVLKAELEQQSGMPAAAVKAQTAAADDKLEDKNRAILEDAAAKVDADISDSYIYTQLDSGFSITARRSDRDKLLAVAGVIDVWESQTTEVVPDDEISNGTEIVTQAASSKYSGQGTLIAVIDSGFDMDHEYFSAAPSDAKYSEADAEELIAEIGRGVYYNAKIPFAYDYYQKSNAEAAISNYADHGTHVAGIAAGKNGVLSNGDVINGTAPEAQLALMACGSSATGINDAAYLAALNDAAKLGADVINMSFGSDYIDIRANAYDARKKVIANARKAGIVICASSGNSSRGFLDSVPLVTELDYGSGGLWQKDTDAISVASADEKEYYITLTKAVTGTGTEISGTDQEANGRSFLNTVTEPTAYADCGLGTEIEIAATDIKGKVALIKRGSLTFAQKTANAKKAGAIAVIMYDNVEEAYPSVAGFELPTLFVKKSVGETLAAADIKTIKADSEIQEKEKNTASGGKPSSFSSWGVTENLELVPNIMGFGGNVYSAADGGGYKLNSGTSMASPYTAGVCACVKSYLNTNPFDEVYSNTADLIQQLIMSTAIPARDGSDVAYSPRQQGAGLVNADAAVNVPVVLLNDANKTLINLGDKLGAELELKFKAHNYSGSDVTLSSTSVEVMTDAYTMSGGKSYVDGIKALNVKSSTDEPITIEAYSDAEISINIGLDESELEENLKIFTNGFYIDGFVRLANDNCSVGIPFMGFYGDWGAMPLWDTTLYDDTGSSINNGTGSYKGTYLATKAGNSEKKLGFDPSGNVDGSYMILSPANGDSQMDSLSATFSTLRAAHNVRLELLRDEEVKSSRTVSGYFSKYYSMSYTFPNLAQLEDGEYTVRLTGWFDDGKTTTKQELCFGHKLIIDNTAPTISLELSEDKASLTVTAEDAHYLRNLAVSYTDAYGTTHSETKTFDGTTTAETAVFALEEAKPGTIVVNAQDHAYNSAERKYTKMTADVSTAFAEKADTNIEGDVDVTGFVTEISGYGSASAIKWTVTSRGQTKVFETEENELTNITLDGGSAYVFLMLKGLNDSSATADAILE